MKRLYVKLGATLPFLVMLLLTSGRTVSGEQMERVVFENDQIKISSHVEECIRPQDGTDNFYVFLEVTNKSAKSLNVAYDKQLTYNGKCIGCDEANEELHVNLTVPAGSTLSGTCDPKDGKDLKIFHHMGGGFSKNVLDAFELNNITITE